MKRNRKYNKEIAKETFMNGLRHILLFITGALLFASPPESFYQQQWCNLKGGQVEFTLQDRTRVDCLTESHAVEVDFADKWAEALGQSLHYSPMTGKRAGILLVLSTPNDDRLLKRMESVIQHFDLPIDVFTLRK